MICLNRPLGLEFSTKLVHPVTHEVAMCIGSDCRAAKCKRKSSIFPFSGHPLVQHNKREKRGSSCSCTAAASPLFSFVMLEE
jgi:hypothetical protein